MAPISKEIRNKVLWIIMGGIVIMSLVLVGGGSSLLTERQKERFVFRILVAHENSMEKETKYVTVTLRLIMENY